MIELMTTKELMEYLGIEWTTLTKMMHEGNIPFLRLNKRAIRFRKPDIERWLEVKVINRETMKDGYSGRGQ
jgi:excisionase family DNA binding protein